MRAQLFGRMSLVMAMAAAAACDGVVTEPTPGDAPGAIMIVSANIGEVLASAAPRDAVEFTTDVTPDARLVYANVDFLKRDGAGDGGVVDELGLDARLDALREARALGLPILLESNDWDVEQVRAIVRELFPEATADALQNVTVLARMDAATGAWTVEDTTPAAVEQLLDPGHARAAPTSTEPELATMSADLAAPATGSQRVSYYIDFAEAAWDGPATVRDMYGNTFNNALNRDVVKVYKANLAGTIGCVVTWRGTRTKAEWAGDLLNQMYHVRPFWAASTSGARVGKFYDTRLKNQRTYVDSALKNNGCTSIGITGHSLGGAMAEYYTTYLSASSSSGVNFGYVNQFAAFNPARIGNPTFVGLFPHSRLATSKVYCRIGDPVWRVPSNLEHVGRASYGCDLWGVDRNPYTGRPPRTNPWFVQNVRTTDVLYTSERANWANHASAYWRQCASTSSC